jgi:hypothetical protein
MRNVWDKSCRENENTHFILNNFFSENRTVCDNVEKYSGDRGATNDVTTWRIALRTGLGTLYARMRMHTLTHPGTHMHHARTHKHAHTD